MTNHSPAQQLAIALISVCLLALMPARAQTADGTVVISGQLSTNTCKLSLIDASGSTNNGVRSVNLGTVSSIGTFSPGLLLGTKQTISFRLTNSSGGSNCSISGGSGQWNLVLDLQTNQVDSATIPSTPFLTNQAASNAASNIGVALFNNQGNQYSTLATGVGYEGTKVSEAGGVFNNVGISLRAQFMATSASAPTPGVFNAIVPLLIVYN